MVGFGHPDTCERMMRIIDGKRGDEMVPCNWPNHLLVGISPLNRDLGDIFPRVCSLAPPLNGQFCDGELPQSKKIIFHSKLKYLEFKTL